MVCAGPMAVELARSIEESGGKVAMLGLIDAVQSPLRVEMRRERAQARGVNRFQKWRRYHLRRQQQIQDARKVRYFAGVIRDLLIARARRARAPLR